MTTTHTTVSREVLDALLAAAHEAHNARDAVESCISPEWKALHIKCGELYAAVRAERIRLWKADRWGKWMNAHDRALATITGEIN